MPFHLNSNWLHAGGASTREVVLEEAFGERGVAFQKDKLEHTTLGAWVDVTCSRGPRGLGVGGD